MSTSVGMPAWRKSRRSSDPAIAACVEVATIGEDRAVRDSKNPGGPHLAFSVAEWRTFMAAIKSDEFDL
ncbi:DUF397 domain-containing protein [Actinomadura alba]|uniref:DUF397 domain-containing protein n=1 Tax=Actinomadura alba TaxID=406431 RepID=A0ABR7LWY7_9ACTN|nr:DUF397 domain-containing protein [Actinomadura alba]MBC6469370.1 DUF397 domain-containing protein [Actinomadura alba]